MPYKDIAVRREKSRIYSAKWRSKHLTHEKTQKANLVNARLKVCSHCGIAKGHDSFYRYSKKGRKYLCENCKPCHVLRTSAMAVRRSASRKEEKTCIRCGKNAPDGGFLSCSFCRRQFGTWGNQFRVRLRQEVFKHYGDGVAHCACECGCDVTEVEFLTIDHINGRKNAVHKRGLGGTALYAWLKKQNYPEGFRTLCFNCNCAKSNYGRCPRIWKSSQTPHTEAEVEPQFV